MVGGPSPDVYTQVFGTDARSPMATITHAVVNDRWYWNDVTPRVGAIDEENVVIGGAGFRAFTYLVPRNNDPFGGVVGDPTDNGPAYWIARYFAWWISGSARSFLSTVSPPRRAWSVFPAIPSARAGSSASSRSGLKRPSRWGLPAVWDKSRTAAPRIYAGRSCVTNSSVTARRTSRTSMTTNPQGNNQGPSGSAGRALSA